VTFDNWFSSCKLATKIIADHRLTIVGTLHKNKWRFHLIFSVCGEKKTRLFGFQGKCSLVSYLAKKRIIQ